MKKLIMMVLGLMVAVGMAGMAIAGNIDSPGAPSAGSGMYTLQQVYDYLNAGTVPTIPGSFQEPSAGPGSTMKTTVQIVAAVATPFAQVNGPAAADVKKDVKFFSTASGSWGVQTGTAEGAAFGNWVPKTKATNYLAATDGFLYVEAQETNVTILIYSDTNPTPSTIVAQNKVYNAKPFSITIPIKKSCYYRFTLDLSQYAVVGAFMAVGS